MSVAIDAVFEKIPMIAFMFVMKKFRYLEGEENTEIKKHNGKKPSRTGSPRLFPERLLFVLCQLRVRFEMLRLLCPQGSEAPRHKICRACDNDDEYQVPYVGAGIEEQACRQKKLPLEFPCRRVIQNHRQHRKQRERDRGKAHSSISSLTSSQRAAAELKFSGTMRSAGMRTSNSLKMSVTSETMSIESRIPSSTRVSQVSNVHVGVKFGKIR